VGMRWWASRCLVLVAHEHYVMWGHRGKTWKCKGRSRSGGMEIFVFVFVCFLLLLLLLLVGGKDGMRMATCRFFAGENEGVKKSW
jgi:hypothetical protein